MRNLDEIRVGRNSVVAAVLTTVAIVGLARTAVGVTPPRSSGTVASVLSGGGGAPTAPPLADAGQASPSASAPEPVGAGTDRTTDHLSHAADVHLATAHWMVQRVERATCRRCTASKTF
jgi:hypothetical protein